MISMICAPYLSTIELTNPRWHALRSTWACNPKETPLLRFKFKRFFLMHHDQQPYFVKYFSHSCIESHEISFFFFKCELTYPIMHLRTIISIFLNSGKVYNRVGHFLHPRINAQCRNENQLRVKLPTVVCTPKNIIDGAICRCWITRALTYWVAGASFSSHSLGVDFLSISCSRQFPTSTILVLFDEPEVLKLRLTSSFRR